MSDPISYMPWKVKKNNKMTDNTCNYSGLASTDSWGKPACEMCGKFMKQEDYDYCDICGDCLDENNYI